MINFYNAFTHLIVSNGLTNVGVRVGQVALHEEIFMSLTVILPRTDSSSLALLSSARELPVELEGRFLPQNYGSSRLRGRFLNKQ